MSVQKENLALKLQTLKVAALGMYLFKKEGVLTVEAINVSYCLLIFPDAHWLFYCLKRSWYCFPKVMTLSLNYGVKICWDVYTWNNLLLFFTQRSQPL